MNYSTTIWVCLSVAGPNVSQLQAPPQMIDGQRPGNERTVRKYWEGYPGSFLYANLGERTRLYEIFFPGQYDELVNSYCFWCIVGYWRKFPKTKTWWRDVDEKKRWSDTLWP